MIMQSCVNYKVWSHQEKLGEPQQKRISGSGMIAPRVICMFVLYVKIMDAGTGINMVKKKYALSIRADIIVTNFDYG